MTKGKEKFTNLKLKGLGAMSFGNNDELKVLKSSNIELCFDLIIEKFCLLKILSLICLLLINYMILDIKWSSALGTLMLLW